MIENSLTTSYLARLSNANHDGVSTQIYDRLVAFQTVNQMLQSAIQGVGVARAAEDIAFKNFSGKDFASDDLKKEDGLEDKYMGVARGILTALLSLPEDEPLRRMAEQAFQLYKDFDFQAHDGFEAEARKTINMVQEWTSHPEKFDLDALGIRPWVTKANVQAQKVMNLITVRIDNESAKVKGALADARKATDAAIRQAYDVLNALNVLQPSTELSSLINVLLTIEERAKQYYISSASGVNVRPNGNESGTTTPSGNGQNTQTGDNTGNNGQQTGDNTGNNGQQTGDNTGNNGNDNPGGDNTGDDNNDTPPGGGDINDGGLDD